MDPARGSLIRMAPPFDLAWSRWFQPWARGVCVGVGGVVQHAPLQSTRRLHLGANHLFDPRHPAGSCKECPESWLPFQASCYFFSTLRATWVEAQQHCERSGAHLVIVGGLEEQVRSPGCLRAGRGRGLPEGRGPG